MQKRAWNNYLEENGCMRKKCVVIETDLADAFEDAMNNYLDMGYKVESSSCNSKFYKAILILEDEK